MVLELFECRPTKMIPGCFKSVFHKLFGFALPLIFSRNFSDTSETGNKNKGYAAPPLLKTVLNIKNKAKAF